MSTIRVLSEETINKIAAGEVIERPANVVKELLENSLDAGSTRIDVEIKGAGRRLLRVRDNGSGMTPDELALSVQRHATSKITDFTDLASLHTLGFRGEALSSIAAVSRLSIRSKTPSSGTGWEIRIDGGKRTENKAWSGGQGTAIEVADLFFNTPARAKFLKTDATERQRILSMIEELCLARPDVSFSVTAEDRNVLSAPQAKTPKERIIDVLGGKFADTLIPLDIPHPYLALRGFVTKTEHSLPAKNHQYVFVNNRPLFPGKALLHAVYEAYRENLPAGRHPGFILFLGIDPAEVDVNIHPTKREARFSKEQEMHQLLYRAIKTALLQPLHVSLPVSFPEKPADVQPPPARPHAPAGGGLSFAEERKPFERTEGAQAGVSQRMLPETGGDEAALRPLGQILGTYVVAQGGNELVVVDQHAAAERIRYERYVSQWQKKKISVQGLLLPLTLELAPSRAAVVRGNIGVFREAGWDVEEFGANTLRISAVPAVLGNDANVNDMLSDIVQALSEGTDLPPVRKIETIIRAACRSSIKAHDLLSPEEMQQLLKDLALCKAPYTCPHGRPTILKISREELEKHFGRK